MLNFPSLLLDSVRLTGKHSSLSSHTYFIDASFVYKIAHVQFVIGTGI